MRLRPRSLLDNAPLRDLLGSMVDLTRVPQMLENGHLRALAVTASSYSSGRHVTFYQSLIDYRIAPRLQRVFVPAAITPDHLLASSAIPFVFPAQPLDLGPALDLGEEYFGDGSMRQIAPISPAIYLGAERVLVIGAGQIGHPGVLGTVDPHSHPSLAQVAGHAMASIFLDALASDIERLDRINRIVEALDDRQRHALNLRPIESLVISPSERLDRIAADYTSALPRPVRALLDVLGPTRSGGAGLASYLLFESAYTRALIDLGTRDTIARSSDVLAFLTERRPAQPAAGVRVVVE
jgi:NTE family protein